MCHEKIGKVTMFDEPKSITKYTAHEKPSEGDDSSLGRE